MRIQQHGVCAFVQEYSTVMFVLEKYVKKSSGSASLCTDAMKFLYYYAFYLRVNRVKANKKAKPGMLRGAMMMADSDLSHIRTELENQYESLDGFLLYVLGLVLIDQSHLDEARTVLLASVEKYPCNWSAWKALAAACPDYAAVSSMTLPDHFMSRFFEVHVLVEMQHLEKGIEVIQGLMEEFPESQATLTAMALAHSHLRNYDEAQELFEQLLTINPNMIENMDIYSNILYVKEDHVALTLLSRRLADEDPYRPETCCVIGNYYSFRGQHDRAVMYFQRALKLNPNFLAAWTLMGHEFVELKNPPAAIEAYRKAVAINPSDYRAWYGLGQTYELVNMPYYALHYYSKAVLLRPEDARMWNAMGHCYSSPAVWQLESAIRCYKRALPFDKERVSLRQLARHHNLLGKKDAKHYAKAAEYYQMILDQSEAQGEASREDAADALHFLAEYHKNVGDLRISQDYYTRLLDYGLPQHREVAKLSLQEIQDMIGQQSPSLQSPMADIASHHHTPPGSSPAPR